MFPLILPVTVYGYGQVTVSPASNISYFISFAQCIFLIMNAFVVWNSFIIEYYFPYPVLLVVVVFGSQYQAALLHLLAWVPIFCTYSPITYLSYLWSLTCPITLLPTRPVFFPSFVLILDRGKVLFICTWNHLVLYTL